MKKYLYLLPVIMLGVFVSSCEDSTTDPPILEDTGSIYIQSTPAGAQIWVDGTNRNKVTPDSVTNLSVGSHSVTLKLTDYRDTTFTVTVSKNLQTSRSVTLVSTQSFTTYTDTLWETTGTTAAQPSGLDLSSGMAVSSNNAAADIFYSSTGFVIRTSTSRSTVFFLTTNSNLNDGEDSPLAQNAGTSGWTDRVNDTATNYFFLFDADSHYSKMKVVNRGGGQGPGDPAWVIVQWHYNNVTNDRRF